MGLYINVIETEPLGASFVEKIAVLKKYGAESIPAPKKWEEGLVCVVDNGPFAAAAYAHNEREMNAFNEVSERTKLWFNFKEAKKRAT